MSALVRQEILTAVPAVASEFRVPQGLVKAIIEVESGFEPFAYNPEPAYRYLWDVSLNRPFRALTTAEQASETPPKDFHAFPYVPPDAEFWGQQASWGVMQVMGAVAREHGFLGRFLPELCRISTGLTYGCRQLRSMQNRFGEGADNWERAIAAYNAGSPRFDGAGKFVNQGYVDKVMARWRG